MKWTIPEKIIEKGRTYANEGRVLSLNADQEHEVWYAEVLGSKTYQVTLDGTAKEEDICECPFWLENHYCKHTIAVELYLRKKGLNRLIHENPVMLLPRIKKTVPASELFLRGLMKKEESIAPKKVRIRPLEIFYSLSKIESNKYHPELAILAISLKIGFVGNKKNYIVKNMGDFLKKLQKEESYPVNQKVAFQLSKEAFDEDTLQMLAELDEYFQTTQLLNASAMSTQGKIDKRYLLLPITRKIDWLTRFIASGNFSFELDEETFDTVFFIDEKKPLTIFLNEESDKVTLRIDNPVTQIFEYYAWVFVGQEIYALENEEMEIFLTLTQLMKRLKDDKVSFEKSELSTLFGLIIPKLERIASIQIDKKVSESILYAPMQTDIYLKRRLGKIDVRVDFTYENTIFSTDESRSSKVNEEQTIIRNAQEEERVFGLLNELNFKPIDTGFSKDLPENNGLYVFFQVELPKLRKLANVHLGKKLAGLFLEAQRHQPTIEVEATGSWLDIRFDVSGIDATDIDVVLDALAINEQFVTLKTGVILSLESEEFRQTSQILSELRQNFKHKKGHLQLPKAQTFRIEEMLKTQENTHFSDSFSKMTYDLNHPEKFPFDFPETVNAQLRDYQMDGVRWLKMLSFYGFGGILADEMGLGKTVQTITYLASEKTNWKGLAVIVAPASLTYNWLAEFEKFCPSLNVAVVSGGKDDRVELLSETDDIDVLVTSYASLRQDIELYNRKEIGYLILDEAQMVKNSSTKTAQALRGIKVAQRFALSGTPIENSLDELWSIFGLVLLGLFPSRKKFTSMDRGMIAKMIQPFILRREKKDVLKSLPEKMETNLYCELSEDQKTVYLAYLRQIQEQISGMDKSAFGRNRISILAGLTRLRQICDDPHLFMDDYEGTSGKLEQLKDIILAAMENKRRILLFSQFTGMLSIIERELHELGLETFYLRGSTKAQDRLAMVNEFNAGAKDVFLISLKAGGTGLNLTGADTVILYDLWWNPAVEEQATGRAHRIGQTKNVEVWRMIAKGTIEERMNQLQEEKRELFAQVISGNDNQASQLSEEDIRQILEIGEEI